MSSKEKQLHLRTEGNPAPGRLVVVHGFLNTWSDELGIEDFYSPQSTENWLREIGLWTGKTRVSKTQHSRLVEFREKLRHWMINKGEFRELNAMVSDISFRVAIDPSGRFEFRATGDPCDLIIGGLLGVIAESASDGTWNRLKCCDLATCGWAFYDSTRSRTKRWCSMRTCGSRHKAREYYKRNRSQR